MSVQSGSALAHEPFMSYVILIYFSEGAVSSLVSHRQSLHGALPLLNANNSVQTVAPKCAVSSNAYLLAIIFTSSNFFANICQLPWMLCTEVKRRKRSEGQFILN